MKKNFKTFKLLLIALMLLLSSGCVKYNVTMDIKKDKSMDFNMIAAFDKSLTDYKIVNPKTSPLREKFAKTLYSKRKDKGMTSDEIGA